MSNNGHAIRDFFNPERFFSYPVNTIIFHSFSLVVYLCVLSKLLFYPDEILFTWIVFAYGLNFVVIDLNAICRTNNLSDGIYGIIHDIFLLLGTSLKIFKWSTNAMKIDRKNNENENLTLAELNLSVAYEITDNRVNTRSSTDTAMFTLLSHYINITELETCMMSFTAVMAFVKLIYFFQVNQWLGPLAIAIRRVFLDVAMVTTAYLISLLGFTSGINFIMNIHDYSMQQNAECNRMQNATEDSANTFFTMRSAFKTSFWSLFDPGTPEDFGCVDGFARGTAQVLWGVYQVVNMIILIPLLVALMSNTMAFMEKDKDEHWKYKRAGIWLRFLDTPSLPAPFLILDLLMMKCCKKKNNAKKIKKMNHEIGE